MAFTPKEQQRILSVIRSRVPALHGCAVCGHPNWTLADGIVAFAIQETPGVFTIGGRTLPCVAIICNNCGNTHFLNVLVLGIGDLAEPKSLAQPSQLAES